MKKHFLKALLILFCYQSQSQTKVTKLVYDVKNEIIGDSVFNGVNKSVLLDKLKSEGSIPSDTINYFYNKKGDFVSFSSYNNIDFINTYINKDKLIYLFIGNLNIITAIDVSIDLEEKQGSKPLIKLLDTKETIGDYECSIVEIKWKLGIYRYYFSDKILRIDPNLFKNYNYDQWFNYLKISKSLPIKIEKEINNLLKTTLTLNSYNEQVIDDSVFLLPQMKEDKELGKMYLNKKIFILK